MEAAIHTYERWPGVSFALHPLEGIAEHSLTQVGQTQKKRLPRKFFPVYLQATVHGYIVQGLSSMGLLISVFPYLFHINAVTASQSGLQKPLPKPPMTLSLAATAPRNLLAVYLPTLTPSHHCGPCNLRLWLYHTKSNTVQAQNLSLVFKVDSTCSFCSLFSHYYSQPFSLHILTPFKLFHINTE